MGYLCGKITRKESTRSGIGRNTSIYLKESCAQANDATMGRVAVFQALPREGFWPLTDKLVHSDNKELDPIDSPD
jgi:hypothetical protein